MLKLFLLEWDDNTNCNGNYIGVFETRKGANLEARRRLIEAHAYEQTYNTEESLDKFTKEAHKMSTKKLAALVCHDYRISSVNVQK